MQGVKTRRNLDCIAILMRPEYLLNPSLPQAGERSKTVVCKMLWMRERSKTMAYCAAHMPHHNDMNYKFITKKVMPPASAVLGAVYEPSASQIATYHHGFPNNI